jgi:NADH-quinone oxidoreductase subunit N
LAQDDPDRRPSAADRRIALIRETKRQFNSISIGGPAVNPVPDIDRILPELILTLSGVAVMLLDASLPPAWPRRPLGWVAAIGTTLALWASLWQLSLPEGSGFFATVETSAFTVFFHVLICGIVLVALLLSLDTLPEHTHHQGEFYALIVFGAVGMCLLTSAVELLVVFIALEISSISTYVLAGYRKQTGRSPEAAIKYFLLGSFATAFLLYGIALIFGATGTTQIYQIALLAPTAQNHSFVLAALALMLVGILFKVSAVPFHVWTPDVYEGAPSPVVALLSTAPKAAAFALLLRVVYEMFPTLRSLWAPLLWIVAVLSMTVGNLAALRQQNVKRMLAYSAIAHAGYLLAAFAGIGEIGIAAASFYIAAYAAMNVGIFAVVTLVAGYDEQLSLIDDYRGLIYRSPILGSLLLFFLISLIGIPFTGGFFAKFYSFTAAVGGGAIALAIIGLLNSGLAAAYYLRLALVAAQRPLADSSADSARPAPPKPVIGAAVIAALFLAAAATLILGIIPGATLDAAQSAAHTLQAPPQTAVPASPLQSPQ